ncbi:MAG: hypothetical protein IMF26_03005 [Candidatus Fermentithermobacillus carboniphilus]|uniref:Uncharacterized protein n=1 Tax=Candidatus Fermentithermobacillus carboniphilus TaxID=3085328 RepID=A0AAT9LEB0_9FIRM|nr:MAG: hypothetical protein IMF26_03005 [Candidatus Fermentithermobacillus carboniphilus]
MTFFEKVQNLDKRVFYLLMALAIAIPTIRPIGLPVTITSPVKKTFDFVESLPSGSVVVIGFDYEPGDEIELSPQAKALFVQLARKKIKVVTISSFPVGPMFAEECLKVLKDAGYQYGVDYVNLGYYAGGESTLAAFAKNPASIFSKDWHGNDVASMPIMKEITGMKDFAMAMTLNDGPTGGTGTHEWVRQSVMAYGTPFIIGCTGVLAANNMPYLDSGQVKGVLSGLRAAAEYEQLVGKLGDATRGMDAQSIGHVLIVAFVLLGNLGMLASRRRRSAGGEKK